MEIPAEDYTPISMCLLSTLSGEMGMRQREAYDTKITEIEDYLQEAISKHLEAKHLILVENKIAWKLMLDIQVVGDINLSDTDYLSYATRAALSSCQVPEVKINFNSLSNEYNVEILDGSEKLFTKEQIPHIFCFGIAGRLFYFDLMYEEYRSVDTAFLGVTNSKGEILQFEKLSRFLPNCRWAGREFDKDYGRCDQGAEECEEFI